MESNDEVQKLEKKAEMLNDAMAEADDDQQAEIQATCKCIISTTFLLLDQKLTIDSLP
jgi:hypothetical protein